LSAGARSAKVEALRSKAAGFGIGVFVLFIAVAAGTVHLQAQTAASSPKLPTELSNIRFNSGQSVVPYFEGWIRNPDGTFDLVFGYFNRNWEQELAIPAGPDNTVELGGPDAGQPTFFLPRRQRFVYRVTVPKDFGKKEVVWSITANGRTEHAFGSLIREQEITERVVLTNGGYNPGLTDPNKPPSVTVAPTPRVIAGEPVTLTVAVADDGLPKPRAIAVPRQASSSTFGGQINSSTGSPRPAGLTVSWMQYGGPGKVAFDSTGSLAVTNGEAVTTARFAQPGTYQLIVSASDRAMTTRVPITVTVQAATR
jgi:hypothetical protein